MSAKIIPPYGSGSERIRNEFQYDRVGNLLWQRLAVGTLEARALGMEYDLNNRKTADLSYLYDSAGVLDLLNWARTRYEYDELGNRTKVTNPLNQVARYYYNATNQVVAILDAQNVINTLKYDAASNKTEDCASTPMPLPAPRAIRWPRPRPRTPRSDRLDDL